MSEPDTQATPDGSKERKALEQSEKKASENQPGSFREDAETDKIVEIPPLDQDSAPIKGLDPQDHQSSEAGKPADKGG